jgi:predicted DCC family thiol-disulfide oxidoreductase YuxK
VSDLPDIGDRLLVIYDGRCGFCNASVRWFLRRDRRDRLRFAPSESPLVAEVLSRGGIDASETPDGPGSILVVRGVGSPQEEGLTRSAAVLALLMQLRGLWPTIASALRLIPRPLRDAVYGLVARNRHRLSGRLEACPIPTGAERERFL